MNTAKENIIKKLQKGIRHNLSLKGIEEGTDEALQAENIFLSGAIYANENLMGEYPQIVMFMMANRSILEAKYP